MWFPYVLYRSIYYIPAIIMSLSSYSSSHQPPLFHISYITHLLPQLQQIVDYQDQPILFVLAVISYRPRAMRS